jgi:FlaA1/EpsC-like NDP-sugar epimerase
MATPDYLQQVVVSGRRGGGRTRASRRGWFRRPSVTSLVWASLDMVTVSVATILALRIRMAPDRLHASFSMLPHVLSHANPVWLFYLLWYGLSLVFFTRSYGLYGPIQNRSGLHEQRMTVQATAVAGLLLCGALYLRHEVALSRAVVALVVIMTAILLCVRRYVWRRMEYSRYRQGLETRNVLIVGAGRVAHALRNHLDSLTHLGFRFKGFVALTEREAESGDADVIGDVRNALQLARSLFVDEIFIRINSIKKK